MNAEAAIPAIKARLAALEDRADETSGLFTAHITSTLNVHGIADTSKLAIAVGPLHEGLGEFNQWSFTPDGASDGITRGPFVSHYSGSLFGAIFDMVQGIGYNVGGAGRVLNTDAAYWHALESDFYTGTNRIFEAYDAFITDDGLVSDRPIYVAVDRHTGATQVILNARGGASEYVALINGPAEIKVNPTNYQLFGGFPLAWTGTGTKNLLSVQNNAGSATLALAQLDNFDRFVLGSSRIIIDEPLGKIGFFGNTSVKLTWRGPWGSARNAAYTSDNLGSYGLGIDSSVLPQQVLAYSASMTPNVENGIDFDVTPTNGTAFTFQPPAFSAQPEHLVLWVINTFGALGAATFTGGAGGYRLTAAWTQPANGFRRGIGFIYSPNANAWYETWRSAADIPN